MPRTLTARLWRFPPHRSDCSVGIGAEVFERYQLTAGFLWDLSHDIRTVKLDDNAARMRGWFIDFAVLF